ncbi:AAA family ATPase [Phaeovulum sp. NW3]|uniref:AAA family ATPase n=1 Tax=Phaeovulum sp. NW3 TaxID=2934933 RepID=UPI002021DE2D|nr:AAA family ATPase [Phaeovulum sp. NW3]MCL7466743.1 AAA family ATPase [Phaeovulum sp. NW3]
MTRIKFVDLPPFQDADTIAARFTATLRRLRAERELAEENDPLDLWDDEGDLKPSRATQIVTYDDTKKIRRRATLMAERQKINAGVTQLKTEELARITPVLHGADLVLAQTEHWADEVAASLHAEMPWMAAASEYAWHALRRAARRGGGIAMRPVILNGPPGIGKSVWARKLADRLSLPMVDIDASKGGAGFALAGVERGWGTTLPGRPLELILAKRIANPIVIVDEVCKAKHGTSTSGTGHSFADALLALIEPATAAEWECPYFRLQFDMSHILWVMTANDVDRAPEPVRSRCQVIQLPDITPAQIADFAMAEGRRMGLSEAGIAAVLDTIEAAPRILKRRLSLRDVIRMLAVGEALETRPRLQ